MASIFNSIRQIVIPTMKAATGIGAGAASGYGLVRKTENLINNTKVEMQSSDSFKLTSNEKNKKNENSNSSLSKEKPKARDFIDDPLFRMNLFSNTTH
jgi:hypothetical protein